MSTLVLRWQIQHWRLYAGVVAGGIFGYILFGEVFFQALAAICLMAFAVFTAGIVGIVAGAQRKAALAAQRPDYAAIARMERPIWGQAFEHAGAPPIGRMESDLFGGTSAQYVPITGGSTGGPLWLPAMNERGGIICAHARPIELHAHTGRVGWICGACGEYLPADYQEVSR